jgi:sugar O-acyltransferase (sialic acid O-acetyltransferase NeuD family)
MSGARPLVILGTGGNALDVLDVAAALGTAWRVVGFLDDALPPGSEQDGFPVLGRLDEAARLAGPGGTLAEALFLNAIGSERNHAARPSIVARTGLPAKRFATLVHPAAGVSSRASLGRGCCIGFGACVGGRTRIGDHAWVGPGCVIGHDSVLEPFALMAPRATISGFVRLGTGSYVGSGATVRQRVTVGANALVGLGAVVLHDVAPGTVVVGNPARELKRHA